MGRTIWAVVGVMLAVAASAVCAAEAPVAGGTFKNLGPQITASTLIGTTFAKDPAGRELVCTVMRGQPAKLVVFDLHSGEILKLLPLVGAEGGWNATTASDGSVYVGTDSNGHLYRWVPGSDAAEDIGQVPPGQTWVWDLEPGKDGEVFLATYNGCRIVRYHPKEGFKEVSVGPASAGEQYARSLAVDRKTGKIYVGVGSHAHLVELDPETGKKTEMLPPEYAGQEFVYGVNVFGDHLFAYVTNMGKSLVINLRSREVEAVLPAMTGQQVMTQSPTDGKVYYAVNGRLYSFDPSKPGEGPTDLAACPGAIGMTWLHDTPEPTLAVFTGKAALFQYDPKTGQTSTRSFKTPTEPVAIQSITCGPDGRMWMGGYLSGGNAAYDPATGKSQEYKGLSQSESIAVLGDSLYFGIYPHGRFATADVNKSWGKKSNPKQLGAIEGQSRPFAGMGVPELKKVFFGTVPEYGTLGGGIAVYDVAAGKLDFFHNVVKDQSVIALAYASKVIVGGTSIWGGLGANPTETEGKLFVWDPEKAEKVFETVPVPGVSAVTCLTVGPDGNVWGFAGGTLFVFDPVGRTIVSREKLFDVDYTEKHVWRDGVLVLHPSGQFYGTLNHVFFRLDPATRHVTLLRGKEAGLLAMDRQGRLYFRDYVNLWQYTPAP